MAERKWTAASFSGRILAKNATEHEIKQLSPAEMSTVFEHLKQLKPPLHVTFDVVKIDMRKLNKNETRMAWLLKLNDAVAGDKHSSSSSSSKPMPPSTLEEQTAMADVARPTASKKRRQVTCQKCGQSCSGADNLRSHEKNKHDMHGGGEKFPCIFCPKEFTTRFNRDTHHNLHTGRRPYTCTRCEARFNQQSNLTRHESSRHDIKCKLCQEPFVDPRALKAHYTEMHPDEKFPKTNTNFKCDCSVSFPSIAALIAHESACETISKNKAKLEEFIRKGRLARARSGDAIETPTRGSTLSPSANLVRSPKAIETTVTASATSPSPQRPQRLQIDAASAAHTQSLTLPPTATLCQAMPTPSTSPSAAHTQSLSLRPIATLFQTMPTPSTSPLATKHTRSPMPTPSTSSSVAKHTRSPMPTPSTSTSAAKHARSPSDGDVAASRRRELHSSREARRSLSSVREGVAALMKQDSSPAVSPISGLPSGPLLFPEKVCCSPFQTSLCHLSSCARSLSPKFSTLQNGLSPGSLVLPPLTGPLTVSQASTAMAQLPISTPPLGFTTSQLSTGSALSSVSVSHLLTPPLPPASSPAPPSAPFALSPKSALPAVTDNVSRSASASASAYPVVSQPRASIGPGFSTHVVSSQDASVVNGMSYTSTNDVQHRYTREEILTAMTIQSSMFAESVLISGSSAAKPNLLQLLELARVQGVIARHAIPNHRSASFAPPPMALPTSICPELLRSLQHTAGVNTQLPTMLPSNNRMNPFQAPHPSVSDFPYTASSLPSSHSMLSSDSCTGVPYSAFHAAPTNTPSNASVGTAPMRQGPTAMHDSLIDSPGGLMPTRQSFPYARPGAAMAVFSTASEPPSSNVSPMMSTDVEEKTATTENPAMALPVGEQSSALSMDFESSFLQCDSVQHM